MTVLILFGDSICYGYGARPGSSWAARIKDLLAGLPRPVRVVNAGINGETSEDALKRIHADVELRRPHALYVQFGLNDASWWCGQEGNSRVNVTDYIANIHEIVQRAFACGCKTVFVATNHPVAENPFGMINYHQMIKRYNQALREAVANWGTFEDRLIFVDLEKGILGDQRVDAGELLADDGVHLSVRGNNYYAHVLGEILYARLGEGSGSRS